MNVKMPHRGHKCISPSFSIDAQVTLVPIVTTFRSVIFHPPRAKKKKKQEEEEKKEIYESHI